MVLLLYICLKTEQGNPLFQIPKPKNYESHIDAATIHLSEAETLEHQIVLYIIVSQRDEEKKQ